MLTWREVRAQLAHLDLPSDDVVLMGSGPMLAHGLIEMIGDIDLVARGRAWERARRLGVVSEGLHGDMIVRLGDVEVFSGWHGAHGDAVVDHATLIDGIRVGTLEDVLAFKLALNRPKDAVHIAALREALGLTD